jgi:hypothetical protein
MKWPRFQFTLTRLLLATFWMAVCFGGVMANRSIPPIWEFRGPEMLWIVLRYATFYLVFVSPFIAVGVLFGRAKTGVIAGFVATSALIAVMSLLVLFEAGLRSNAERNEWIATAALHFLIVVAGTVVAIVSRLSR